MATISVYTHPVTLKRRDKCPACGLGTKTQHDLITRLAQWEAYCSGQDAVIEQLKKENAWLKQKVGRNEK